MKIIKEEITVLKNEIYTLTRLYSVYFLIRTRPNRKDVHWRKLFWHMFSYVHFQRRTLQMNYCENSVASSRLLRRCRLSGFKIYENGGNHFQAVRNPCILLISSKINDFSIQSEIFPQSTWHNFSPQTLSATKIRYFCRYGTMVCSLDCCILSLRFSVRLMLVEFWPVLHNWKHCVYLCISISLILSNFDLSDSLSALFFILMSRDFAQIKLSRCRTNILLGQIFKKFCSN